jgi:hypothetical protein
MNWYTASGYKMGPNKIGMKKFQSLIEGLYTNERMTQWDIALQLLGFCSVFSVK